MKIPRKAAFAFTLLLLIGIAVLGADPWISFGPPDDPKAKIGIGFERYRGLMVVAPTVRNRGRSVLQNTTILRQTGGGLMVNTAEPEAALANRLLQVVYIPSNEDGQRFQVTSGRRKVKMDLFDWEAKPLIEFVDSRHHGAIHAVVGFRSTAITLDDAFQQRLMGLRFIHADLLLSEGIASQRYLPRDKDGVIYGGGEKQWLETEENVQSAMQILLPLFGDVTSSYTVLTDAGELFTFSMVADKLEITGTPYFMAWSPDKDQVLPAHDVNRRLRDSWPTLRRANPLVIRAVERAFRATAFFRYQQQRNPSNWRALVQQVSKVTVPVVPTPRRLERRG